MLVAYIAAALSLYHAVLIVICEVVIIKSNPVPFVIIGGDGRADIALVAAN